MMNIPAKPAVQGGAIINLAPKPAAPTSADTYPAPQPPAAAATPQPAQVVENVEPLHDAASILGTKADITLKEGSASLDPAPPPALPPPPDPTPGSAMWKYIAVAEAFEAHEDFDKRTFDAPMGFSLLGARTRGRKHKHDGSNCDDWFEVKRAGEWEIIAVSDGAGSCRLSRIGAQISTEVATDFLAHELAKEPPQLPRFDLERDPSSGEYSHPMVQRLQELLHKAVNHAVENVKEEARRLFEQEKLPSDDPKPLSSTLRLAIHRLLPGTKDSSILMACSVGDGMTAAIDANGQLHLLGLEESGGKYSGETEFLTDSRSVAPLRLIQQTFATVLPVRSVMVMSDGVADPYFPNHTEIYRLYADLILNGIVEAGDSNVERTLAELKSQGGSMPELSKYSYLIDAPLGPEERMTARIRQAEKFAAELNLTPKELLKGPPALLQAGACGEPMNELAQNAAPEERLRIWMDSFYVRGEFDDRTLVILHREAKA